MTAADDLDEFRATVRAWCEAHIPDGLAAGPDRASATRSSSDSRRRGSPNCTARASPSRTGRANGAAACRSPSRSSCIRSWPRTTPPGSCSPSSESTTPHRHCSPRAPTSSAGGTCPRSSTARSGCRASPNPRPAPTWPVCARPRARTGTPTSSTARSCGRAAAMHADWCLLLARTDPDAPKRHGISYFLLDMTTPGVEVRPIRNAIGDSHFCEIFLNDVVIPAANLVGAENAGWQVAQATLGAERGMTMLELAERLGNAGFRWLRARTCRRRSTIPWCGTGWRSSKSRSPGCGGCAAKLVEAREAGTAGAADASIVKLYYSELLQRMTDFGAEIGGCAAHTELLNRCRADGSRARGCWTSSARGNGRSRAGPARSSAPSSASAAWDCRENRARCDGARIRGVPRRAQVGGG